MFAGLIHRLKKRQEHVDYIRLKARPDKDTLQVSLLKNIIVQYFFQDRKDAKFFVNKCPKIYCSDMFNTLVVTLSNYFRILKIKSVAPSQDSMIKIYFNSFDCFRFRQVCKIYIYIY